MLNNCKCIPGWWATLVYDDTPFEGSVLLRELPRLFMFNATRPPLGNFRSHEDMFRAQALEIILSKYLPLNLDLVKLEDVVEETRRPIYRNYPGEPNTFRLVLDGIIYRVEPFLCLPPTILVPAHTITHYFDNGFYDGFWYTILTTTCGTFSVDFDDVPTYESGPDNENHWSYEGQTIDSYNQGFTTFGYKKWDGGFKGLNITEGQTILRHSNNPAAINTIWQPYNNVPVTENIGGGYSAPMTATGINHHIKGDQSGTTGTMITTYSLVFGSCPVPSPFPIPPLDDSLCVDNTGVEHLKLDSEFNFYACRISNTVTCGARILANGLARLAAKNRKDVADWIAAGSPAVVGSPLGGLPVITPADIARVTALASLEAIINCPPNIDNGYYPPLYLDPSI